MQAARSAGVVAGFAPEAPSAADSPELMARHLRMIAKLRGFLLPRMQTAFGRDDWVVNGVLFALYHVHQPWSMPAALADTVLLALPSRRFRSAWFGIVVHSAQSVLVVGLTLAVVLS